MIVKPVDPTVVIRDPHTQRVLPAEGGEVPDTTFWRRRILHGEVVLVSEELARDEPPQPESSPLAPLATRRRDR